MSVLIFLGVLALGFTVLRLDLGAISILLKKPVAGVSEEDSKKFPAFLRYLNLVEAALSTLAFVLLVHHFYWS